MIKSVTFLGLVGVIIFGSLVANATLGPESNNLPNLLPDTTRMRSVPSLIYCGEVEKIEHGSFVLIRSIKDTIVQQVIRVHFSDKSEKILHGTDLQKIHLGSKFSMRLRPEKDGTFHVRNLFNGEDCQ